MDRRGRARVIRRKIVSSRSSVNSRLSFHTAATQDDLRAVDMLLSAGLDVNSENPEGHSPLALATSEECTLKLLSNGASTPDVHGLQTALHVQIASGRTNAAVVLARERPHLCGLRNMYGLTPLHMAITVGDLKTLQALLSTGRAMIDVGPVTPLRAALEKKLSAAVELLLDAGANPNLLHGAESYLEYACIHVREAVVPLMRAGAIFTANVSDLVAADPALADLFATPLPRAPLAGNAIHGLVFMGGGVRGIAYVGALRALVEDGKLDLGGVVRVAGASAGAITALAVGLDLNINELEELVSGLDVLSFLDGPHQAEILKLKAEAHSLESVILKYVSSGSFRSLVDTARSTQGLCPGNAFENWAEDLIRSRTGIERATFADLRAMGYKDMYFVGTNIARRRSQIFSADHTPDVVISSAVRISMSIPLLFEPRQPRRKNFSVPEKFSGQLFVDGGLLYNFPIDIFDNTRFCGPVTRSAGTAWVNTEVLGLRLVTAPSSESMSQSLMATLLSLSSTYMEHELALHERTTNSERSIDIDDVGVSFIDFDLSDDRKAALKESGAVAARGWTKPSRQLLNPELLRILLPFLSYSPAVERDGSISLQDPQVAGATPELVADILAASASQAEAMSVLGAVHVLPGLRSPNGSSALHVSIRAVITAVNAGRDSSAELSAVRKIASIVERDALTNVGESPLDFAAKLPACPVRTELVRILARAGSRVLHRSSREELAADLDGDGLQLNLLIVE